jgi:hypothetical protein
MSKDKSSVHSSDLLRGAMALADKREWLCRCAPTCSCGSQQVQLMAYVLSPAQWRCRHCRHVWFYEPLNNALASNQT